MRRLPRGEPPGKNRSDTGNYDEAKKLSREPAFDFLAGLATNKIVPYEQADGDGSPSIDRCLVGKPQPHAEVDRGVVAGGQARQQEPRNERIAEHGEKEGCEACQLK